MIDRSRLQAFFMRWQSVRKESAASEIAELECPEHLKRAYKYFMNWKSYRLQSLSMNDHDFKATVFKKWSGLLKEHRLALHLHNVKLLPANHRASIILVNAFDEWREALDYKRRQQERLHKVKERMFASWKSCHLRLKVRNRAANLYQTMSLYKTFYSKWRHVADQKSRLDKLGLLAWYQKMVGDSFIAWRKLTSQQTQLRRVFKNWRLATQLVKKSEDMACQYHQDQLKRRHLSKLLKLGRQQLTVHSKANALLEGRLRAMRREKFATWRLLTDEQTRQQQVAKMLYATQQKSKVLRAWSQTSAYQKAADEHLRGNLLVKGLYFWRAALANRTEQREIRTDTLQKWLFYTKARRLTRYYFGQVMLKSVGKYGPSSKSLSILLPSPELSASQALKRADFDNTRNKARCLFLWLHKYRRAHSLRQAAIDYRKVRFAKTLHKWRSQHLLRNAARNEPYNLRRQYFKRWMVQARVSSTAITKIDKKLSVLVVYEY